MREFELLKHIYEANASLGEIVEIAPGDDMAMVRIRGVRGGARALAAVDQVIDGVHFSLANTPIELIGRKAITRNLSDIAAMAVKPVASLAAAALPADFSQQRANELFDAMRATAAHYNCPLIGGDIAIHKSASHPLTLSVTVLAEPVDGIPPVTRGGARPGDVVYVTGRLGGSFESDGLGKHLTFEPRINEAIELARTLGDRLHAMIDISDGLGRDAGHIAEMSNVAITLFADFIPCTSGIDWKRALGDGEDYELCFAAAGDVPRSIGELSITRVGEVRHGTGNGVYAVTIVDPQGAEHDAAAFGWEHRSERSR